ncbi:MAG: histidine kinase, partial [candidate division Zixibacteria bacterium]|nr:histidine kinase [candidate division Zixibacteria bacterium]
ELLVRDNGHGFDFEQVRSRWRQDTSFGLLNITERVELLGGQLDITTGKDIGTDFQITIANK